jgi:glycine oxidase
VAAALAARRARVRIVEGTAVRAVLASRGCVVGVRTDRGRTPTPLVVNAAGAWAAAIAMPRGALVAPVTPVRGQMVVLAGLQDVVDRPVHATDVYLAPRPDGRLLAGSTYERVGFDKRTTARAVRTLLAAAERVVPAVAGATVVGAYAGLRPGNPDGLPIVGPARDVAGLWYACGLYRNGILLAPAVAGALADLVTRGETAWPVAALSPARFGDRASVRGRRSPRALRAARPGRPRSSRGSRRTPRPR